MKGGIGKIAERKRWWCRCMFECVLRVRNFDNVVKDRIRLLGFGGKLSNQFTSTRVS